MAEHQPAAYLATQCYTARDDRDLWNSILAEEGVAPHVANGFAVTPGVGMSVNVDSGSVFIRGTHVDSNPPQGMYHAINDGVTNKALLAADPTNPRIDLIVARIYDIRYGDPDSNWVLEVVTGAPNPVPVAPTAPVSSVVLAEVYVGAGDTTVDAPQINQDTRSVARVSPEMVGFGNAIESPSDWTAAGGTDPDIGDGNATVRAVKNGKIVNFTVNYEFGGSTVYGTGTNAWTAQIDSDAAPAAVGMASQVFPVTYSVGANKYAGQALHDPGFPGVVQLYLNGSPLTAVSATSFAWAAGDGFTISGAYEAA